MKGGNGVKDALFDKMKKLTHVFMALMTAALMISSTIGVTALAMEVPTSEVCQEVNGRQILTRVFTVSPDVDPSTLISADFEKDGFIYTFDSIIKTEQEFSDTKRVTKSYDFESATKDLSQNIAQLPAYLEYEDDEGYVGELYLEPRSVTTEATGYHTTSRVVKAEVTYPDLTYNDPSLVPSTTTKNGTTLSLKDISWSEGAYLNDSSIPGTYTATATYSKTLYSKVADSYRVTAEYYGDVQQEGIETVEYTVTYLGTLPQHSFLGFTWTDGGSSGSGSQSSSFGGAVLRGLLLIIALLAILVVLLWALMKLIKAIRNMFVIVQAQDDTTGEYKTTQRVRLKKNDLVIELDTLKAPGARHYMIMIPKKKAEALAGKIITIHSPQETFQHQVGDAHGMDYTFQIDFDPDVLPRTGGDTKSPPAG